MSTRGRIGPRYASDLSAAQHLRGWKEWALPSVANFAIEMAETEEHKSNWRNPGWESPSSSSSSFADGSALTETGRTVTEVGKSRVGNDDRPGVPAQSERANSGRTELQLGWKGRSGEVVNATSSATAEATRRLRFNTLRLRMATRFPVLNIEHTITSRIGELCQVLTTSVTAAVESLWSIQTYTITSRPTDAATLSCIASLPPLLLVIQSAKSHKSASAAVR
jgi:hypothetical protein